MDTKEKIKAGWIHFNALIEIMGRPQEYVEEVLHKLVDDLKKMPDSELLKENFSEPLLNDKFYNAFVELEVLVKNIDVLQTFVFTYLPSSVEIISPYEMKSSLQDLNTYFNDLCAKLHEYDAALKKLKMENMVLFQHIKKIDEKVPEEIFHQMRKEMEEEAKKAKEESEEKEEAEDVEEKEK